MKNVGMNSSFLDWLQQKSCQHDTQQQAALTTFLKGLKECLEEVIFPCQFV
jgi:dsDNA-binding SOS-regulon protein